MIIIDTVKTVKVLRASFWGVPSVLDESPAVLRTAGLSKRIRKEVIFDDIFPAFPKGKVTAITGQNGAGKTTLAQIICGLARQTRGHILMDGEKARAAVRRREIYHCGIFSGRRILILDEPTSGLDGQNMRLIAERLRSEARNGRTILVITHDRELIESCCDNIVDVEKRSS